MKLSSSLGVTDRFRIKSMILVRLIQSLELETRRSHSNNVKKESLHFLSDSSSSNLHPLLFNLRSDSRLPGDEPQCLHNTKEFYKIGGCFDHLQL
jgi:hypothetical protein